MKSVNTSNTTATAISAEKWHQLLTWATNPSKPSSPAARLSRTICDDTVASDLVEGYIITQVNAAISKGKNITPALVNRICHKVSIETLLHQQYDIPASQTRAATLYNRRRATLIVTTGVTPSADQQAQIWDDAIREHMARQVQRRAAGEIRFFRWLPLSDGRSSNPHSARRNPDPRQGLAAWNRFLAERREARAVDYYNTNDEYHTTDGESFAVNAYSMAHYSDPADRVDINARWLADHGITQAMIAGLSDEQLEDMGLDPQLLRSQAAAL